MAGCLGDPGRAQPRTPSQKEQAGQGGESSSSAVLEEPRPLPRDGGGRSALISPAAVSPGRRESPETHPCCPGTRLGNTPRAAGASSARWQWLCSCCSREQGTRSVTLPGQEQELAELETAGDTAGTGSNATKQ